MHKQAVKDFIKKPFTIKVLVILAYLKNTNHERH